MDYGYMGDEERQDAMTMLVMKDRKTRSYSASTIPKKGVDKFSVQMYVGFLTDLGHKRYIAKSDGEPSILALKKNAAAQLGAEMVPQESPAGDHAANGEAENAVK